MSEFDWKNQGVMVTGGAGFIGSTLVDQLVFRGARVKVYDDLSRGHMENLFPVARKIETQKVDLRYHRPAFNQNDIVFHLAARVTNIAVNQKAHFPMWLQNSMLTNNMVAQVAHIRPKLFVAVSTVCVYPHDAPVPTPETAGDICNPEPTNHGYGVAKWTLEQAARYLHLEYDIPCVVVRFSNAFGLRDYYDWESSHVVPAFIRKAYAHDKLVIWGSGEQTRSFVDSRDIAKALINLAETPAAHDAKPINIGHQREISMMDLAKLVLEITGQDKEIELDTTKPNGHQRRGVDNSRLQDLIGWVPNRPIAETISDMVEEFSRGMSWL